MLDILKVSILEQVSLKIADQYKQFYKSRVEKSEEVNVYLLEVHKRGINYKIHTNFRKSNVIWLANNKIQVRSVGLNLYDPDLSSPFISEIYINAVVMATQVFSRYYPDVYISPITSKDPDKKVLRLEFVYEFPVSIDGFINLFNNYQDFDSHINDFNKILTDVMETCSQQQAISDEHYIKPSFYADLENENLEEED